MPSKRAAIALFDIRENVRLAQEFAAGLSLDICSLAASQALKVEAIPGNARKIVQDFDAFASKIDV